MTLEALDPQRVQQARAEDARRLLREAAHDAVPRVGGIAVVGLRHLTAELLHRRDDPAVVDVLVVDVVEVEADDVLILDRRLDSGELALEGAAGHTPMQLLAVGMTAPGDGRLAEVVAALPLLGLHEDGHASAVGPWGATEDAERSLLSCCLGVYPLGLQLLELLLIVLLHPVVLGRLVEGEDEAHGLIQQRDQRGEGVAQQA